MIGIAIISILAIYLTFLYPIFHTRKSEEPHNARYDMQMKKLWNAAQTSMRDQKPLRAEKALLTILKFDEKNAAAYNRLGILYAKEQKFDEAIECFEIAQSLDSNPSCLHNVGLIYLETGAYEKAAMAFEQAIELENTVPARFIALAKARERLGQTKAAIDALESAFALDQNTNTLRQILAIHEITGDTAALADLTARIEAQIAKETADRPRSTRRAITRRTTSKTIARPTTRQPKPTVSLPTRSAPTHTALTTRAKASTRALPPARAAASMRTAPARTPTTARAATTAPRPDTAIRRKQI